MTDDLPMSAIVTGASGAIGRAVAYLLAGEGFAVTATGRSSRRLGEVVAELEARGARACGVVTDLRSKGAPEDLLKSHLDAFGCVDALVLSAGTGTKGQLAEVDASDIDRMMDVNVKSPMLVVRHALPGLLASANAGRRPLVVVLASLAGSWPVAGSAVYSASKAAARSLARSINLEVGAAGVMACAICPGYVDTPMTDWISGEVPKGEMLDVADVVETVRYLLRLSPTAVVHEIELNRRSAAPWEA